MTTSISRAYFAPFYRIAEYIVRVDGLYEGTIRTAPRGQWKWISLRGGSGYETSFPRAKRALLDVIGEVA